MMIAADTARPTGPDNDQTALKDTLLRELRSKTTIMNSTLPQPSVSTIHNTVTIAIGLLTKDSIVLATDSQVTYQSTGTKEYDSQKLYRVEFKCGTSVLIAKAGVENGSNLFREIFERIAEETEVTNKRTVVDAAEAALIETRTSILAKYKHEFTSEKDAIEHLLEYNHIILLAYWYDQESFMYLADQTGANPIRQFSNYTAMGVGRDAAAQFLIGAKTKEMCEREGMSLASCAVRLSQNSNLHCEGYLQLGYVKMNGKSELIDRQLAEAYGTAAKNAIGQTGNKAMFDVYCSTSRPHDEHIAKKLTENAAKMAELDDMLMAIKAELASRKKLKSSASSNNPSRRKTTK
jgi:20S proteasome alpha/beta subunit